LGILILEYALRHQQQLKVSLWGPLKNKLFFFVNAESIVRPGQLLIGDLQKMVLPTLIYFFHVPVCGYGKGAFKY
jgi:hypothetical protein